MQISINPVGTNGAAHSSEMLYDADFDMHIRDVGLLESAIAQPEASFGGP
jgi:hypothetical protein